MKKALIALGVVALLVGGYFLFFNNNEVKPATETSTPNTQNTQSTDNNEQQTEETTITYDGSKFSPDTVTVKSGSQITVKNTSTDELEFVSDPHPSHTDNPELNAGIIDANQSSTFTVNQKGTWGYHNHLDQTKTGTIIVE